MKETIRQLIHVVFGLCIAGMILFVDHTLAIPILAGGLFFGLILVDLILRGYHIPVISSLVKDIDRADPLPGKGAFFFAVSALLCAILFPVPVVVPALVTIAVLDSVTTMIGIRYGRTRIHNGKSLEGTISGIIVTSMALLPFLSVLMAFIISAIAGVIELFSPLDDNLIIPPAVCILLSVFPVILK